jgi:hypothetical protein
MPCSKLEVSTVQHGTLSGAGYLHQSPHVEDLLTRAQSSGLKGLQPISGTGVVIATAAI